MKKRIFKVDIYDLDGAVEYDFEGRNAFKESFEKAKELSSNDAAAIGLIWGFDSEKSEKLVSSETRTFKGKELEAIAFRGIIFVNMSGKKIL